MKTSWDIKNVSNKRVQLLHLTYDDSSKDLEIKDAETNTKIVFFVENLKDFKNQLDKILDLINKIDPSTKSKFSDHLKKVRLKYINAYKPWSKENDTRLKKMYLNGVSKSEISKYFGRGPGSILARLKRLGLIEDEDESDVISD
tara:strand:+ start:127 stop:558 length:432 start_codon:yes stop_codon:yes gene_type:complete